GRQHVEKPGVWPAREADLDNRHEAGLGRKGRTGRQVFADGRLLGGGRKLFRRNHYQMARRGWALVTVGGRPARGLPMGVAATTTLPAFTGAAVFEFGGTMRSAYTMAATTATFLGQRRSNLGFAGAPANEMGRSGDHGHGGRQPDKQSLGCSSNSPHDRSPQN